MDTVTSRPEPATSDPLQTLAVVAVVVTCDPGWWLEECLQSLIDQDYPQLSVLVVDADSVVDPTPRIAAIAPAAYVRRTKRRRGFGTAANEVLGIVEGASHFLFCHDDVVLSRAAIRLMVEEAVRSNAGVVAPKLVGWFHPERLLAVGMGADGFAAPVPVADRGDLDQEQHDAVRDVFYAPSPCFLVRADLFTSLGGFDPGYGALGEDLDLSWRAHLAGARVVNSPSASVAHLEATEAGQRALDGTLLAEGVGWAARPQFQEAPGFEESPGRDEIERAEDHDDEPETVSGTSEPLAPHHHVSGRARRIAERDLEHEEWSTGTEWEIDEWEPLRRRRRTRPRGPATPTPVQPPRPDAEAMEDLRHAARLRALAANYGWARLAVHLPVLLAVALGQAVVLLFRRDRHNARRTLRPWAVLLAQSGAVRKRRGLARKVRTVPDSDVAAFLSRRTQTVRDSVRPAIAMSPTPEIVVDRRLLIAVWIGVIAVLGFGTRHIIAGHLPTIGELAPWPSLSTLADHALSGWRTTGLGVAAAAPTAFSLLTAAGVLFLGHMTLLQHVLFLGMVPLGIIGAARLARPFGSRRAQAVTLVAYAIVPLPYNAIAGGRWGAAVAYGVTPWVFGVLLREAGVAPFVARGPWIRRLVRLAVVVALAAAVEPGLLVMVVLLALVVGAATTRQAPLRLGVLAPVASLALVFPWVLSWIPPAGEWVMFTGAAPTHAAHVSTLLRMQLGPLGAGPLGYALLVTAALPLVIGKEWRSEWAVRLGVIAVAGVAIAWAGQHASLGLVWPSADVLLAPVAASLAMLAGLGMASFDTDLPGSTFGRRQVVAGIAAASAVLACAPVVLAARDGSWHLSRAGFDASLSWMGDQRANGDFRVLWVGSPEVLPAQGWTIEPGLSFSTSVDGPPVLTDRWPATSVGTTNLLGQAVQLVQRGDTTTVGHLLAPMGVRYVVIVEAGAPLAHAQHRVPGDLTSGLQSQLDLHLLSRSAAASVYENSAWIPMRAAVPSAVIATAVGDDPRAARTAELSPAPAVLTHHDGPTSFSGPLASGVVVEVAQSRSRHWQLTVGGHSVQRQSAWGSANLFTVGPGGAARLHYNTPPAWRLAVLLGAGVWIAAAVYLVRTRR